MIANRREGPIPLSPAAFGPSRSFCVLRLGLIVTSLFVLLALVPLGHVCLRAVEASRNVAYWDEVDTAVAFVLRLHHGLSPGAFLDELFAVNNEHRMLTSRLVFTASYWLSGTLNFTAISALGNAALVFLCLLLVVGARTAVRRIRLALVLAFILFQLENYENFLWSGASIDHFQVLLYVGAAVLALAQGTRVSWLAAGLCAILASLTLAHGLLVWLFGAAMLWRTRRYPQLIGWCALATLVACGYAVGFSVNDAHRFAGWDGCIAIIRYWLALLGAVPAVGHATLAPWLGGILLAVLSGLGWSRAFDREPVSYTLAWFGVAALALVAVGRAEQVGGLVMSRYLILSALSWSLTVFMLLERISSPRRPLMALACLLPVLVAFNVAANWAYADAASSWLECRDIAVSRFSQHGADGRGNFSLSPIPARATKLLMEAERQGIFQMAPLCFARTFPQAKLNSLIIGRVDEFTVNERSTFVRGWAVIPGVHADDASIHLILRGADNTHTFTTVTVQRPDVSANLHDPRLLRCGYLFTLLRDRLPTGDFQIGFLIKHGDAIEYVMTDRRLFLPPVGHSIRTGSE